MFLPIFPLELVVFPGDNVPLHIFEPRYKQLIGECRDRGITFGIPPLVQGHLAKFGTELELATILNTYDSGELDIIVRGLTPFRIDSYLPEVPGKLYSGANVERIDTSNNADEALESRVRELVQRLQEVVASNVTVPEKLTRPLSYEAAQITGLSLVQKLQMLSLQNENERLDMLREHLERTIPKIEAARTSHRRAGSNGHAKGFPKE